MQNLQKKVYHKNRFYKPKKTNKLNPNETRFKDVFSNVDSNVDVIEAYVELDNLVVFIDKNNIKNLMEILKNMGFDVLSEMSAIHMEDDTFEIFYQLLNMNKVMRLRVKTRIVDSIESISSIFRNALWCEREAYDMFGIRFINHPALKRLIMPDDWYGHPLRKDYPLQGDERAQWYEIDRIFGEDYRVKINPENRNPSFIDPKDTFNFAHMEHEVPKGTPPSNEYKDISYQEDGGVFVVTKFDKQTTLKERR